jgi:hypothetical protein
VHTPELNRLAGIDFGPTFIEYQVDLVIARANRVLVDVDDAIPLVGSHYASTDALGIGRPGKE